MFDFNFSHIHMLVHMDDDGRHARIELHKICRKKERD